MRFAPGAAPAWPAAAPAATEATKVPWPRPSPGEFGVADGEIDARDQHGRRRRACSDRCPSRRRRSSAGCPEHRRRRSARAQALPDSYGHSWSDGEVGRREPGVRSDDQAVCVGELGDALRLHLCRDAVDEAEAPADPVAVGQATGGDHGDLGRRDRGALHDHPDPRVRRGVRLRHQSRRDERMRRLRSAGEAVALSLDRASATVRANVRRNFTRCSPPLLMLER